MVMAKIDQVVDFTTLVRARPEVVYDSLATEQGLDSWFTKGASVEARAGGEITFRWHEWGSQRYSGSASGPVVEAERPVRFVFQWPADSESYFTTVTISLTAVAEGTIVKLIEQGFRNTASGMKDMLARASGWGEALTLMKFYIEHGVKY